MDEPVILIAGNLHCNNLQNVGATTYKTVLQQPTLYFAILCKRGLQKTYIVGVGRK